MGNTVVEYYPSCVIRRIPTGITCFGSNPFMLSGRLVLQNTPDDLERSNGRRRCRIQEGDVDLGGCSVAQNIHGRQKARRSRKVQVFIGDNTRGKCGLIPDALNPDSLQRYKNDFQHSVSLRPPKLFLICVAISATLSPRSTNINLLLLRSF
jgi:hypothetical protein